MENKTSFIRASRIHCGISDFGQIMGRLNESALASVEKEGTYEHLAIGDLEEGYTIAYSIGSSDYVSYDVYSSSRGIIPVSSWICKDDDDEFIKVSKAHTYDEMIELQQIFTFSKNTTRILISMIITNCSKKSHDLEDLLIKRFADIDTDTGGTAGWADYKAHWDKNRYSVFSYNLEDEAPQGKRSHIVNMIALPSDLPLDDVFIGNHGDHPFKTKPNTIPVHKLPSVRIDADGILQWRSRRFLSGETIRINMCYDCYESFYK